jgi:hypothetical protein
VSNFGKKVKVDFITTLPTNRIYNSTDNHVIIAITYKDFKKFAKDIEKRHKYFMKNKKVNMYLTHLSPDVSFLVSKK